ncbi:hypothetical protein, partial [Acetobacter lambici]|uniref:hypothetical protein n=1 Tax=Acetobacter lambici TaxID=1332824 RepID=UPI0020A32399
QGERPSPPGCGWPGNCSAHPFGAGQSPGLTTLFSLNAQPPKEAAFFMERSHMSELQSATALNGLVSQIAGKHEDAAVKADLNLAGTAVSLLVQTLVPRLDPALDLNGVDTALSEIFSGMTKLAALTAGTTVAAQVTQEPATDPTQAPA